MLQKVQSMLALIERQPDLQVFIFSGNQPGALERALSGDNPGTTLRD
jgi:isopentenyl phosphate kinase